MKSEEAVELLVEFAMAIIGHYHMKFADTVLEADNKRVDDATAAKMDEIRQDANTKAKSIATTILTALLNRPPTEDEVNSVTRIAVDSPP